MQRKVAAILSLKSYPDWLIDYWPSKYLTVFIVCAHTCALVTTSVFLYSLIDFFLTFYCCCHQVKLSNKKWLLSPFFLMNQSSFFRLRKPLKGSWKCSTHQFHKEGRELSKMSFFHRTKWNVMHFLMLLRLRYVSTTALKLSLQQNTRMRLVFQLLYFYLCTKKSWLFNTELLCRICIFGNF